MNLEVTQLLQLPHISSIGDHKTWIVEITTRSMLGCNLLKIQRTIGRRLTLSNHGAVTEFIRLVKKGCEEHDISHRMKDCLRLVKKIGTPTPKWLKKKLDRSTTCRKYALQNLLTALRSRHGMTEFMPTLHCSEYWRNQRVEM